MQRRASRPDPYNGFKDDQERRRALNTRARSYAVAAVAAALAGSPIEWTEKFRWLINLLH